MAAPHDSHPIPAASSRRSIRQPGSAHAGSVSEFSRRGWLQTALAGSVLCAFGRSAAAAEDPPVTNPRATDGDSRFEPAWDERLTLTVGPREADLVGHDDKVIQAALDYVARRGGGTVQLLPGTYTLRASVFLPSGIRLLGSGPDTILTKIASTTVPLRDDSDWYDQEITLSDSRAFRVGDSVLLRSKNPHDGGATVIKRTLIARSGDRFKLNDGLRENLWLSGTPTCSSLFPLLTSEHEADVVIEHLTLDGNLANNEHLDGNYGGCIFLQDCNRFTIRRVEARNNHGDGISFQICHDVVVDDCHSHHNSDLGVHPGSGSQRPRVTACRLEHNRIGLFWCWGVKYGLAERNQIADNRDYGISIGHNDTDNVMNENQVARSGKIGILFRDEARGRDFWPNRNTLERNRVVDSGGDEGIAIDVQGKTRELVLTHNVLEETRAPAARVGIRIAAQCGPLTLADNQLTGFATPLDDRRPAP